MTTYQVDGTLTVQEHICSGDWETIDFKKWDSDVLLWALELVSNLNFDIKTNDLVTRNIWGLETLVIDMNNNTSNIQYKWEVGQIISLFLNIN